MLRNLRLADPAKFRTMVGWGMFGRPTGQRQLTTIKETKPKTPKTKQTPLPSSTSSVDSSGFSDKTTQKKTMQENLERIASEKKAKQERTKIKEERAVEKEKRQKTKEKTLIKPTKKTVLSPSRLESVLETIVKNLKSSSDEDVNQQILRIINNKEFFRGPKNRNSIKDFVLSFPRPLSSSPSSPVLLKTAIIHLKDFPLADALLKRGLNLRSEEKKTKLSMIKEAVQEGSSLDVIRFLVENGADYNFVENGDFTPLSIAADRPRIDVLKFLLTLPGIEVNSQNTNGWSPLMICARHGVDRAIPLLLQNGAKVNLQNKFGITALMAAASRGNLQAFRSLLEADGVDVNLTNRIRGDSALSLLVSSSSGSVDDLVLEMIRKHRLDLDVLNHSDMSPLMLSIIHSKHSLSKLLLDHKCKVYQYDAHGFNAVLYAVLSKNRETARRTIEATGRDAMYANSYDLTYGFNTMMYAIYQGDVEMVKDLLQYEKDLKSSATSLVNYKSLSFGFTPLMFAVEKGCVEIAKLLLEHRANPNVLANGNVSSLMIASCSGDLPLVKLLLSHRANPSLLDENGHSALDYAKFYSHPLVFDFLCGSSP